MLDVSVDTLRRWDRAGKLRTVRDDRNRRLVPEAEIARLGGHPARHRTGDSFSARNRFAGTVRSVEVDGVMALVEIEAGPHLVTAAITRDAVEELGLVEGAPATATVKATSVMVDRGHRREETVRPARPSLVITLLALGLLATGCGDDGDDSSGSSELVVSAAASLEPAFTAYADEAGIDAKQSFAGSDDLAAQIRQGVKPDVFASANTTYPEDLYKEDLVEKPVVFATNTLVLAVPEDSDIASLDDISTGDVTLAIGDKGVPVGDYTREVLARLPADQSEAILGEVRSEEPDVAGIVGKLTQGAVDAGFVYITDVAATDGALKAIDLPTDLQPDVAYGAAVVKGANDPEGASSFIDGLLNGQGAEALDEAGFGPPPK